MAKKVLTQIKLQIPAGKANPAPPVGPALGQHGLQIQDFCNQFNNATKEMGDTIVPVVISVYEDRTFSFITKTPPAAVLLMKAAKSSYGADAVINVEYWPDPESEGFPRGGTIYARGEMVRYLEFPGEAIV